MLDDTPIVAPVEIEGELDLIEAMKTSTSFADHSTSCPSELVCCTVEGSKNRCLTCDQQNARFTLPIFNNGR